MLPSLLLVATLGFVSPEQAFGELTPEPALALSRPTFAFDGTNYFSVWHDHRSGGTGHIFGRFLTRTGAVIGPDFNLLDTNEHKDNGTVLFDGTNYAVSINFAGFPALIRVSKTGALLDPQGIVLSASAASLVRMAYDGTNYLLVWSDSRGSYREIRAARVSKDGRTLDQTGVVVSANVSTHADEPDVVFDGTNFLVVWKEDCNLLSVRLAADATPLSMPDTFFTAANDLASGPRLTGRAGGAVATFLEVSGDSENEPRLIDVAVGAAPTVISTRHANERPEVTLSGSGYVAIWSDSPSCHLWAARFDAALTPQDGDGVELMSMATGSQYEPAVASDGSRAALLGFNKCESSSAAVLTPIDLGSLATSMDGTPFVTQPRDQSSPDVAQGATRTLVGWIDQSMNRRNVTLGSATMGGTDTVVEVTTGDGQRYDQGTGSDGANRVLVAWRDENADLRARLFDEAGNAASAEQVLCSGPNTWSEKPRVAWDGAQFVVAFLHGDGSAKTVRVVRLKADASPTVTCGEQVALLDPTWALFSLNVAAGGGTVLVLLDQKDENTYTHVVQAVRERAGAALDAAPFSLAVGAGAEGASGVWSGAEFLVVWHQSRRWSHDVVGTRVPASGAVTDSIHPIATSDANELFPAIGYDGTRALVAWSDMRAGRPDIYASFVDSSFAPAGPQGVAIANTTQEEESPSVVALSPGRFAVAYTRFGSTAGGFARRIGLRFVSDLAQAAGCTQNEECQSGFCTDGVCCDSACGGGQGDCEACTQAKGASADGVCTVLAAQTQCRGAASECDVPEFCDGSARACPADLARPDGLACSSGAGVCGGGQCKTGSSPHFTSAVSVQLSCGQTWSYSKAGRPQVAGDGPFTFSARTADGSPLPDGFTIDPATGELSWQTTRAQAGAVTIELRVESPAGSDTQVVELVVDCTRREVTVSCASVPGVVALLALALLRRRRRG